jgi:putative ABC transport system permease protein
MEDSLVTERMVASISAGFTALPVVLCVVGLYGVHGHAALAGIGHPCGTWRFLCQCNLAVMREVLQIAFIGIAVAIPLALLVGQLIQTQLYHVKSTDPAPIATAATFLSGIVIVAGFVPARRAASSDPLQILRHE